MHLFSFESPHNWELSVYHLSIFNTMQQQRFTWVVLGKRNWVQFCAHVTVYLAELENVQQYAPPNASTSVTQHKANLHFLTNNYWSHYVELNLHCKTAEKNLHKINW